MADRSSYLGKLKGGFEEEQGEENEEKRRGDKSEGN